jgi:hypothetical protein
MRQHNILRLLDYHRNHTSGFSAAAASFWALADPELSPRSSSSVFSFLAPPPNIAKTLSFTPTAAEVTVAAADEAASVAFSVTVYYIVYS